MKNKEDFLEKFAIAFLIIVSVIGLIVTVLDLFGIDFESSPWNWIKKPEDITLLIVSTLAFGLGLERYVRLKRENTKTKISERLQDLGNAQEKAIGLIIGSLNGVEIREFESEIKFMSHMNKLIVRATIRINDASWGTGFVQTHRFEELKKVYSEFMRRVAKISKKIPYREVFVFDRLSRFDRFRERIEEKTTGYSCAYFKEPIIPLLEFMVIDEDYVLIFSNKYRIWYSIKHPLIAKLFSAYFNELWDLATILKRGYEFNWDEISNVLGHEEAEKIRQI